MSIDIQNFMENNYSKEDFSHLHWSGTFSRLYRHRNEESSYMPKLHFNVCTI
jgi:hypothetical protein